ncbi:MAG: D-glycero-beta-D-manno-heptose 1,7-bisphosphate 7-phosphatase [Gammaproteobacteria bacterium]|nr:D-glycero-beta-D-manno-heptose 1,7-bisphosphate 7-phosphatase [Gammaproteobacteria bacterium]
MKLIILDRDGVINQDSDDFIKSPDEWLPIEGSLEAIAKLTQADYKVVVVTNQSGIARGFFDMDVLNNIHSKMIRLVADAGGVIDVVFFCPHSDAQNCTCRKPKAGMFEQISERFHVDLVGVPAVGDSLRDLQAAASVRARPLLVRTGKGLRTLEVMPDVMQVPVYDDLAAVVADLLSV